MRLIATIIIISFLATLASCGGAETKVDPTDTIRNTDTVVRTNPGTDAIPESDNPVTSEPRSGSTDTPVSSEKNDILKNIDRHLVSTQSASDRLTVENTLANISFQRVIVEVSELDGTGNVTRTNFYTVTNLDPGTRKVVKITAPDPNAKVSMHIVKAKSDELTKGEMILVGSRYTPG